MRRIVSSVLSAVRSHRHRRRHRSASDRRGSDCGPAARWAGPAAAVRWLPNRDHPGSQELHIPVAGRFDRVVAGKSARLPSVGLSSSNGGSADVRIVNQRGEHRLVPHRIEVDLPRRPRDAVEAIADRLLGPVGHGDQFQQPVPAVVVRRARGCLRSWYRPADRCSGSVCRRRHWASPAESNPLNRGFVPPVVEPAPGQLRAARTPARSAVQHRREIAIEVRLPERERIGTAAVGLVAIVGIETRCVQPVRQICLESGISQRVIPGFGGMDAQIGGIVCPAARRQAAADVRCSPVLQGHRHIRGWNGRRRRWRHDHRFRVEHLFVDDHAIDIDPVVGARSSGFHSPDGSAAVAAPASSGFRPRPAYCRPAWPRGRAAS